MEKRKDIGVSRKTKGYWSAAGGARIARSVLLAIAIVLGAANAPAQAAPSAGVAPAAQPAPPPLPPAAPPAPAPASGADADRQWLKSVYEQVADSVVLIETETGAGSGFFFYSTRHVATALHVVDDAESIVVNTTDGRRFAGQVVAYSRDYDVALVELRAAVPGARILPAFHGPVDIGETVAVIGHPFTGLEHSLPRMRGLLNWSLTQGVVSAVAGSWVQTDAAINPGNSGGPVLNKRGEVLGVVSAKLTDAQGIGMIARIKRVEELIPLIGTQPPPRQLVAFDGVELGYVMNWKDDDDMIDGFAIGSGVRVAKRTAVNFRLSFLGGDIEPSAPTVVATHLTRFSTELTFGYVLALGPLELTPSIGAALFYDRRHDSQLRIDEPLSCATPPCYVEGRVVRTLEGDVRFLPLLGVHADLGILRAAYAYEFDVGDPEDSQHRAIFALNF